MIECHPKYCPCGEYCQNQTIQNGISPKLVPFLTEFKGWGLKAAEKIDKGQFVIEYVGEVIDLETCRARLRSTRNHRNFFFLTLNNNECIDASRKGNLARFINHSCNPNCQTQKWVVRGELRIAIFASKDIEEGEEVTFDYQFERIGAKKQPCYCNESTCRGYLGAKPKKQLISTSLHPNTSLSNKPASRHYRKRKSPNINANNKDDTGQRTNNQRRKTKRFTSTSFRTKKISKDKNGDGDSDDMESNYTILDLMEYLLTYDPITLDGDRQFAIKSRIFLSRNLRKGHQRLIRLFHTTVKAYSDPNFESSTGTTEEASTTVATLPTIEVETTMTKSTTEEIETATGESTMHHCDT